MHDKGNGNSSGPATVRVGHLLSREQNQVGLKRP